jgi:hypothetical protein
MSPSLHGPTCHIHLIERIRGNKQGINGGVPQHLAEIRIGDRISQLELFGRTLGASLKPIHQDRHLTLRVLVEQARYSDPSAATTDQS